MKITVILALIVLFLNKTYSQINERGLHQSTGPENGTLLIGGGGMTEELWNIFLAYAGKDTARLVIIPTSMGENSIKFDTTFAPLIKQFTKRGFNHVQVLHTKDSLIADTEDFVKPLKSATAVWFTGGRQWRTIDSYQNTLTHKELVNLLDRGGIIGGHSAGASVQGSFLVRGRRDYNSFHITGGQETGFGFIKNIAIDQHHLSRNRHYDMFQILERKPEILGIGIDDNTAILVKNNTFEVVGESYVTIYDGTFWSPYYNNIDTLNQGEEKFYFLDNGRKYHLEKRQVIVNRYLTSKPIDSVKCTDYIGKYQVENHKIWFDVYYENDSLFVQRTFGPNINPASPIFLKEDDVFFDKGSTWWYRFIRDEKNNVVGMVRDDNKLIKRRTFRTHKLK